MNFDRHLDPPEDTRRAVYNCEICNEPILEGDEYYNIPNFGICCAECISDAHHYDAECEGPDPDEAYEARRGEVMLNE